MNDELMARKANEVSMMELHQIIGSAVQTGIGSAMTEQNAEQFWKAGVAVLQKQATKHAGEFVLGGLFGFIKKGLFFVALGLAVYSLGGWSALAATYKAIFVNQ